MKVYEILLQYSTDDGAGVDSFILDNYEKAVNKFKELIEDEKTYINWVKDAFKNKKTLKDYEFETNLDIEYKDNQEHELYWEITDKYDWYRHDFFELRIKEII